MKLFVRFRNHRNSGAFAATSFNLARRIAPHSLDEALACYQKAVEIDPQFARAWEEIGWFHDAVLDDKTTAEKYFRKAKTLKEKLSA
jgi:tetratricopeptide (TPR) repeat protein